MQTVEKTTTTTVDGVTTTTTTTTVAATTPHESDGKKKGTKKRLTKEEAKIEREATESASAAITAFLSDGSTANGPEMSFKLFRINTSAPDYDKKNWCGPCWRKDCAWGYVLLILALVYAGVGSYFGYQVRYMP